MRGATNLAVSVAAAVLLAATFAACGGSDDSGQTKAASSAQTTQAKAEIGAGAGEKQAPKPERHKTAGKPSRQENGDNGDSSTAGRVDSESGSKSFIVPGGDNSIQRFGGEADSSERERAAAALESFLDAQANREYARACSLMSEATQGALEQLATASKKFKGADCATILRALTSGASPVAARTYAPTRGVASLRVKGDRGFALYHGSHGTDYFMPMVKEDGEWKVGSLAPSAFP